MRHRYRLLVAGLGLVALAVALALLTPWGQDPVAANGTVHYVDADATTGGKNGSSWADAFIELQPALDAAASGDQIWVAAGTYTPTAEHGGTGDRHRSFQMVSGVAIYGGFAGAETEVGQRDWTNNVTILSGDIGIEGDSSDNSYHVFYHPEEYIDLDSSAILDGFTITGGNANGGGDPHYYGGGMYNATSSPAVSNCTFSYNWGDYGGGMYNDSSWPTVSNCTFEGNSAYYGGGMSNRVNSSPVLSNCTFSGNSAEDGGGGMYNDHSSPTLTNCTFSGNSADWAGGMFNYAISSPTLTDCTFEGNTAVASGGGGMDNYESSSPTLTNCTFKGNSASSDGGGMRNRSSSPTLTNCSFEGNSAAINGGGIYNTWSSPALTNCILWGDSPEEMHDADLFMSPPVVSYSDVQGGYEGEGNIDAHPRFLEPHNGDFHLHPCSPCIDAGDPAGEGLPPYDFEGDDRIIDGDEDGEAIVDMGVDEVAVVGTCYRVHLPLVLRVY